ncbi:hypothetical protein [Haloarchaeobius sp. TZWWS8]|uniref:hypothetical protein n=1 Tax=Haloarchaeobius sp. TZWWS8 TaxID=3446121 RepID=UPI003EB78954
MGRSTHHSGGVTVAACIAAVGGLWGLVVSGLLGALVVSTQSAAGLAFVTVSVAFGLFRLFLAGALFQLHTWARPVGILTFLLAAALNGLLAIDSGATAVVPLVANLVAAALLLTEKKAFGGGANRADIRDEHATSLGTGSR